MADFQNNRVLEYDHPLTSQVPTRVFGQGGSFTTASGNNGGISASSLALPCCVAVDSTNNLSVGDFLNSRVLEFDVPAPGPASVGGVSVAPALAVRTPTRVSTESDRPFTDGLPAGALLIGILVAAGCLRSRARRARYGVRL